MAATSATKIQDDKFSSLGLTKTVIDTVHLCCYTRSLENTSEKNPVLVLIHGYPQSAYE
jgi:hypothetical protein